MSVQNVASVLPGFTSVGSSVPWVPVDEVFYGIDLNKNGRIQLLRLEQWSVVLMKNVAPRFCNLGELVLDKSSRTLTTSRLPIPEHWTTIGGSLGVTMMSIV